MTSRIAPRISSFCQPIVDDLQGASLIARVISLLEWDEQVNMPPGGARYRAEQLRLLSEHHHERLTRPDLRERIDAAEARPECSVDDRLLLKDARKTTERAAAVPQSLVGELGKCKSDAYNAWIEAREKNDFSFAEARLTALLERVREFASCLPTAGTIYDRLLDLYEPDCVASEVRALFEPLRGALCDLAVHQHRPHLPDDMTLELPLFPVDRQHAFSEEMAKALGFDLSRGRFDRSVHPFCETISAGDIRITSRYDRADFRSGLYATLHETGHALYEQGLDAGLFGTVFGESCSLGVHESMSSFWENFVGRSPAFIRYLQGRLAAALQVEGWDFSALYEHINAVRPSIIRVSADEVTYGLHIIIRFELEQKLVDGTLSVADLPAAWNEAYERTLGLTPATPVEGVLQDVHWYTGAFGYFPTYLLGRMYAAQLLQAATVALPDLGQMLVEGRFSALREWLADKVYSKARTQNAKNLLKGATGSYPSSEPFINYLTGKYGASAT